MGVSPPGRFAVAAGPSRAAKTTAADAAALRSPGSCHANRSHHQPTRTHQSLRRPGSPVPAGATRAREAPPARCVRRASPAPAHEADQQRPRRHIPAPSPQPSTPSTPQPTRAAYPVRTRTRCSSDAEGESCDSDVEATEQPVEVIWRLFRCRAGQVSVELLGGGRSCCAAQPSCLSFHALTSVVPFHID